MAGKGLGAGLGALFGESAEQTEKGSELLAISLIEPRRDQPRQSFDEEQLAQLMCEVAADARERYEKAHAAYFAHIDQMIQAL